MFRSDRNKVHPFLRDVNLIIEENLCNEDFNIDELCEDLRISRSTLYRKISLLSHSSTGNYIRAQRLKKAKILLMNPRYLVAEVAYAVGFNDPNYFTRVFRQEFGFTPTVFRDKDYWNFL